MSPSAVPFCTEFLYRRDGGVCGLVPLTHPQRHDSADRGMSVRSGLGPVGAVNLAAGPLWFVHLQYLLG